MFGGVLIAFAVLVALFGGVKLLALRDNPGLFRPAARSFDRQDRDAGIVSCDNVLTGSSVMRYWRTLEDDLAPAPALNRAIPGTKIDEIASLAPELVVKYRPRRVFLYAGSNDIQGYFPRSAVQVLAGFEHFVDLVRASDPAIEVNFISIIASPARPHTHAQHRHHPAGERRRACCLSIRFRTPFHRPGARLP